MDKNNSLIFHFILDFILILTCPLGELIIYLLLNYFINFENVVTNSHFRVFSKFGFKVVLNWDHSQRVRTVMKMFLSDREQTKKFYVKHFFQRFYRMNSNPEICILEGLHFIHLPLLSLHHHHLTQFFFPVEITFGYK